MPQIFTPKGNQRLAGIVAWVGALSGALLIWEALSHSGLYNSLLFPPPSRIGTALFEMALSGELWTDLRDSLSRYAAGFALGNVLGILLGLLTGRIQLLRNCLSPLLNLLRSIPSVALIPLAIVWFGIGEDQKIFIVTWGVTFPVWLGSHAGASEVEAEYVWVARSLSADGWRMYREVHIPRALPFMIAGARIGIATAFFALTAAEMAGAFGGIAFRILHSHQMFRTDKMMVGILVVGVLGLLFDRLFVRSMQWLFPWWAGDMHVRN